MTSLTDTWEWDGTTWTERSPATSPARPVDPNGLAFDTSSNRVLGFGGAQGSQLWAYSPVQQAAFTPFGTGCPTMTAGGPAIQPAASWTLPWIGCSLDIRIGPIPAGSATRCASARRVYRPAPSRCLSPSAPSGNRRALST
ncbi:MAG: hypothetical protein AAF628_34645 [Planctomycetota bacterium]